MPDFDLDDADLGEILAGIESNPKALAPSPAPLAEAEDDTPPELPEEAPALPTLPPPRQSHSFDDDDDDDEEPLDPEAIMESMGTTVEPQITDIFKAWMHYHEFVVVDSIEQLEGVIAQTFKTGKCSLDLETQGLDNRIYKRDPNNIRGPFEEYWDGPRPDRVLQTVHKIVGYCLSPDGYTGYYVPVRHTAEGAEKNLDLVAVGKLIRKLCLASQPVIKEEGRLVDPLASALIEKSKVKIFFWHAKFDQEFLLPVTGIDFWHPESFEDAMLVYYCIYTNDKSLGLKDKSHKKLSVHRNGNLVLGHIKKDPKNPQHEIVEESKTGVPIPYEMIDLKALFLHGRPIDFGSLDPHEVRYYACSDAICTFLHCDHEVIKLAIRDSKFAGIYRIEKQIVQVLRWMERNRIKIDHDYVRQLFTEAREEADSYRKQIVALAEQQGFKGFDPQSTQQLSEFLFASPNGLNIEPKPEKTKNELRNQYKTDADTLEKLVEDHPDINPILITIVKYRQVEKVIGTYLTGMLNNCDENSELRYQFKQTGAPTGRFTAPAGDSAHGYGGIPIHGIPATYDEKKPKVATALRKAFVAREGYTMAKVDFAGEELRIVTNLSGEPVWIKEFNEGSGDLHTITAKAFFSDTITKQQRQMGKCVHPDTIVFSGGTPSSLRFIGSFPETPDTFRPWSGTLFDGKGDQPTTHLYNGGEKELFHIVTSGGIITCTGEHRFKTREDDWVRVVDLQEGALLEECQTPALGESVYPTLTFSLWNGIPAQKFTPNHALAYFAGLFVGGGSSCVALSHEEPGKLDLYGTDYEEWRERLEKVILACGFESSRKDFTSINFESPVVIRFLTELEVYQKTSKDLRVPSWVMSAGKRAVLHYIRGLFDTDDIVGEDSHNLGWTTKDLIFAGQVSTLLKACGLSFNVELTFNETYQEYYTRLSLTVGSSWAIRDYIRHPGKRGRLREPPQVARTKDQFQVFKILPAGVGPCLDVTMGTEEHQYQVNGFISHNSANFSLVYGGGTMAVMRATKCTQQEAARRKANFDKAMPVFNEWVKKQKAKVKKDKGVYSAFGRWMAVPDVDSPDKAVVAACERYSLNYPIQACLQSSSQVLTGNGYFRIGDLIGQTFKVWTGTKWATATAKSMGNHQLADITLSDGTIVRCDNRHKQLGVTSEGYQWVDFDDLTEGLRVATSLCYPVEFSPSALPKMEKRSQSRKLPKVQNLIGFWYWMGRYLGDGSIDTRGGIRYSFGSHERAAINECLEFWSQCGLKPRESNATHTPKYKTSTRYTVGVSNVNLIAWLAQLGFNPATAHTKRLPPRILQETLEHRKSFIRGVMDSDGHKPPMVSAKGNPYNIHLCQRPLLEDLKLLLRTLGVESIIRGPYRSGSDKNGEDTTSYRLDLNRRMFERNVQGVQNRGPKFYDMFAPDFLVQDFLSRGDWKTSDFRDNSSYVLYRRLVNGGKVSVYTLEDLCKQVGVTLSHPIYGYKSIKSIKILDQVEETYTLSVEDPLHRFEADGVITKNSGADIMKMSMVMLYKEFYKKGWLQGDDPKARFMLTVHDEIVFEIKHEMLMEVMPVIERLMTEPGRMKKWKVQLEVEPLIDAHWDPKYDYHKIMKGYIPESGKKPKDSDIKVGDRYYQKPPPWLEGILVPDYMRTGVKPDEPPVVTLPLLEAPKVDSPKANPQPSTTPLVKAEVKKSVPPPRASVPPPPNGKSEEPFKVYMRSWNLTSRSVREVAGFCQSCFDANGQILHLIDSESGETLISPDLKVLVNPKLFKDEMDRYNLGAA
jgi:DNA polymerase I-like protein with 3'-5' exonuclease and polymerase domains/intein/homing endonuclease